MIDKRLHKSVKMSNDIQIIGLSCVNLSVIKAQQNKITYDIIAYLYEILQPE